MVTSGHDGKLSLEIKLKNANATDAPIIFHRENDWKVNVGQAVDSFPSATVESTNPSLNSYLRKMDIGDKIELKLNQTKNNQSMIFFEGEGVHRKKNYNSEADEMSVKFVFAHSCYRLSQLRINTKENYKDKTLKDFFTELLRDAKIECKINIDKSIESNLFRGLSSNQNLLRIFKTICYLDNLIVSFHKDNSLWIKKRNQSDNDFIEDAITITQDQILSFSSDETL